MRRIKTTVQIDAPPEQVWHVLVDFPAYVHWSPTLTVSGRAEPGQRLDVTAAAPGRSGLRFSPRVLAAEPGRVLRWRGQLLLPGLCDGTHEFVLTPAGDGTALVHAEDFSGVLVPLLGKALAATERNMLVQNEALKRRVESGGGAA